MSKEAGHEIRLSNQLAGDLDGESLRQLVHLLDESETRMIKVLETRLTEVDQVVLQRMLEAVVLSKKLVTDHWHISQSHVD